jgi:hypothetical protein
MISIPVALLAAMAALLMGARSFVADSKRMEASMAADAQLIDEADTAAAPA